MNTILKRALLLLVLAVSVALLVNRFSPAGIALIGQWDRDKGAISARAKKGIHDSRFLIDNIETAKLSYDSGETLFVDARSNDDYNEGHIKGAISLPIGEFDVKVEYLINRYLLNQSIVTYCSGRTCEDSHRLAQKLIEFGYENVSIMIDGFPAWKENEYPVE